MNTVFFKNIDRSEALEQFILDKTQKYESMKWIIGREGKDFSVKCVWGSVCFKDQGDCPQTLVTNILHRIKSKLSKAA